MSDDEDRSETSSGSDSEDVQKTGLIATRAKRATAGNLYATLRANLDDEDLQRDLLAEDADDVGDYEGSDREDDDAAFDSSSDDEDDAGPPKDGDAEDLSGEKELKRAERVAAGKKRKAQDARLKLPSWQKKKHVKIADDVQTSDGTAEPLKKKSERANRAGAGVDGPTRQSSRAHARASREITHAHIKKSNERSEKQRRVMKNAAKREKATRRMDLTLEERLQRAAKIEKETKREFGRWEREEAERQRVRDELLAAKRQKGIAGPFLRYWSGSAIWQGNEMRVKRVVSEKRAREEEEEAELDEDDENGENEDELQKNVENESDIKPTGNDASGSEAVPKPPAATDDTNHDMNMENAPNEQDETKINEAIGSTATIAEKEQPATAEQDPVDTEIPDNAGTDASPRNNETPLEAGTSVDVSAAPSRAQSPPQTNPDTELPPPTNPDTEGLRPTSSSNEVIEDANHTPQNPSPEDVTMVDVADDRPDAEQPPEFASFLEGIHDYATLVANEQAEKSRATDQAKNAAAKAQLPIFPPYYLPSAPGLHSPLVFASILASSAPKAPTPPPLPLEQAQRCLLMLEQFPNLRSAPTSKRSARAAASNLEPTDVAAILMPGAHPRFSPDEAKYLTVKALKKRGGDLPPRKRCALTAWPAKYRDPHTGLAYADVHTYKIIQRVLAGGCQWSSLLGAWVGPAYGTMGRPAHGVPEGFAGPIEKTLGVSAAVKTETKTT